MQGVVEKAGNNAAVRIPASVREAAQVHLDQSVDVREEAGRIVIEPLRPVSYDLPSLVVAVGYVPDAGDIVWLQFDPQAGHEQAGHRPAVVLSPASYNGRAGMIVCCPTATRIKGYPFEVTVKGTPDSVVLADKVKSQDWRAR